jgi:hypothetical protein
MFDKIKRALSKRRIVFQPGIYHFLIEGKLTLVHDRNPVDNTVLAKLLQNNFLENR